MKIKKVEVGGEPTVKEILWLLGELPEEIQEYKFIIRTEGPPCYVSQIIIKDEEREIELS